MGQLRHILVGTDLSKRSLPAIERGYRLAEECHARCTILHAVGLEPGTRLRELLGIDTEPLIERLITDAHRRLHSLAATTRRTREVTVDEVVEPGSPDRALSALAEQHDCDLLILGNRGSGAGHRRILGSTASRVLRKSRIPVLIVKKNGRGPYRVVLIPVDFSPVSRALVEISQVIAPEAHITLLHVCTDAMEIQMRYASVADSVITEYRARAHRQAAHQLSELARRCGLRPEKYTQVIGHGRPAEAIGRHEEERRPDLIVLGKHGTHVTEELLLGSVTKRALDSTRADVLVIVDDRQAGRE